METYDSYEIDVWGVERRMKINTVQVHSEKRSNSITLPKKE